MPIYEYQCSACHHKIEKLQKISDAPLITCSACHKDLLVRLVSAAGFQLKGTGWYATDFKDKPKDKSPAEKATSSEKTEAKTTTDSIKKND